MNQAQAPVAERRFPCRQCGARLEYAPGTTHLVCPYCRAENDVPAPAKIVEELDYSSALSELSQGDDHEDQLDVKCSACGAEIHGLGARTALSCPYCGSNIVATAKSRRLIKPRALLPFKVTRAEAQHLFARWLASLWLAPSELKRHAQRDGGLSGMYMPAWTYDCDATSAYTGRRGDYYYITVPYTTMVNGRPVVRMRQERRIRWSSAAGTVFDRFDDVLVLASGSLPRERAEALEPWDLKAVVAYDDAYLAGFGAESYQVDLPKGFDAARAIMRSAIEATVRADIGGDVQEIATLRTRHERITFKHLLLPVWISAYRFRSKIYRFLVNARTGEVQGERPWSAVKITGLVLVGLVVIGVIALIAAMKQ